MGPANRSGRMEPMFSENTAYGYVYLLLCYQVYCFVIKVTPLAQSTPAGGTSYMWLISHCAALEPSLRHLREVDNCTTERIDRTRGPSEQLCFARWVRELLGWETPPATVEPTQPR